MTTTPPRRTVLLGCPVDLLTSAELLTELRSAIDRQAPTRVIQFVNGNKVAQVREDREMGPILWRADYVLTDGQPLVPLARLLGIDIPERIDGIGLMWKLLSLADQCGYSIYLLGAKQEIVEACAQRIKRDFPNVKIAGYRNGYFTSAETPAVISEIREARPDILFLGMGSPAKERFADKYARELGARVIQGVGGSFDVLAGLVKRAPVWMQRLCLEWMFRVLQEPRRMLWRYAKTNTQCLAVFSFALLSRMAGLKRKAAALARN